MQTKISRWLLACLSMALMFALMAVPAFAYAPHVDSSKFPHATGSEMDAALFQNNCGSLTGKITFSKESYPGAGGIALNSDSTVYVVKDPNGKDATVYSKAGGGVFAPAYSSELFLKDLNAFSATALDLSGLDTSKVTNMYGMFQNSKAASITGLTSFDTSQVTDMHNMFNGSKATSLDLSSFDTSKVANMSNMFACTAVTSLDLSSFKIQYNTNVESIFDKSSIQTVNFRTATDMRHFENGGAFRDFSATETYSHSQKYAPTGMGGDADTQYIWNEDNSECYAKMECVNSNREPCTSHNCPYNVKGEVTKEQLTPATCAQNGTTRYSATFPHNDIINGDGTVWAYAQTKDVDDIPATGKHNMTHHAKVDATDFVDGTKEYWECSECHNKYLDADGLQKAENDGALIIEKKGFLVAAAEDFGNALSSEKKDILIKLDNEFPEAMNGFTLPEDKNVTLDLNGKTITVNVPLVMMYASGDANITIPATTTLTVKNGTLKTGIANEGNLNIEKDAKVDGPVTGAGKIKRDGVKGENSVPVTLNAEASTFSATVPTGLPVAVDAEGNVTCASNGTAKIVNSTTGPVKVTNVAISGDSGWEVVAFSTNMDEEKVNTKKIAFTVNGVDATTLTAEDFTALTGIGAASGSTETALSYTAKIPVQTTALDSKGVANIVFTIGWDEAA